MASFVEESAIIMQKIDGAQFDIVYSSPLERCKKLSEQLFSHHTIYEDHRLVEMDFGEWEGEHWDTIYQSSEGKSWFNDYVNERCPNGESFITLIQRVRAFLVTLLKSRSNNAAIVTHAGVIRSIKSIILGISPHEIFKSPLPYGSITHLTLTPESLSL